MSISTSTIWSTIFNIVSGMSYTHPLGSGHKYVFASFPDTLVEDKTAYPIIVINHVDLTQEEKTYNVMEYVAEVNIDIFTTNSELLDTLTDKVIKEIQSNRDTLEGAGLYRGLVTSSTTSMVVRSGMKVHMRSLKFEFLVGDCI